MALADVDRVTFAYPGAAPALRDVSLRVEEGEVIALLGASGSGKSTLLRALSGLVPHFHGGRFAGRVLVAGRDTREARPAELAGTVATLFQDPEDQVILTRVEAEIAFGLENLAVASGRIGERIDAALVAVDAAHLRGRRVAELSGGELQRVCIAAVLALEPRLLLLDEPSSQLDPEAAAALFAFARASGCAVVVAEQRPQLPLAHADRVVFMDSGEIVFDLPLADGIPELPPAWLDDPPRPAPADAGDELCRVERVSFAYRGGPPVLDDMSLVLRRGEIVALHGANGAGKTTLAKLVSGLLRPSRGRVLRHGRPAYLSQDPGRYLFEETVLQEVCLAATPDVARRMLASVGLQGMERRHPRDLSSGERERLAVACVLAVEPDILVLDEPTRGVDPLRKLELAELLLEQRGSRATLVVTHDLRFAAAVADRVVTLGGVTARV